MNITKTELPTRPHVVKKFKLECEGKEYIVTNLHAEGSEEYIHEEINPYEFEQKYILKPNLLQRIKNLFKKKL